MRETQLAREQLLQEERQSKAAEIRRLTLEHEVFARSSKDQITKLEAKRKVLTKFQVSCRYAYTSSC